jgi:hypothetical protein
MTRFVFIVLLAIIAGGNFPLYAAESFTQATHSPVRVEFFLSSSHKGHQDAILEAYRKQSVTNVRTQLLGKGNAPQKNIGIGKNVSAEVGRLSIQLAIEHNPGVQFLLLQDWILPDYITIGSSVFNERGKRSVNVTQADIEHLLDPSLSTVSFHQLYRTLTKKDVPYENIETLWDNISK